MLRASCRRHALRNKELKRAENKGFPGIGAVWTAVSIPGFLRSESLWELVNRKKIANRCVGRLENA